MPVLEDLIIQAIIDDVDQSQDPSSATHSNSTIRGVVEAILAAGYSIKPIADDEHTERPASPPADDGQWALVELMGHRRVSCRVEETTLAGTGVLRLDIPNPDGSIKATQYVNPASLYCLTPVTRERVLEHLYPPVRALERGDDIDDDYDGDDEDHDY